jgi:hypothetical protein
MNNTKTPFGFRFGPLDVERTVADEKFGYVVTVKAGQNTVTIRTSPNGRSGLAVELAGPKARIVGRS